MENKPNYRELPVEELVDEIVLRLPAKSLVRFRCVSKRWLALINSPDFNQLHLNRSIETRTNRILIVRSYSAAVGYWVNVESPDVAFKIDHPLKNSHNDFPLVMGSCRGLVLLTYPSRPDDSVIWNPFTRNYHKLPPMADDLYSFGVPKSVVVWGIGYDSVHGDYKVVRIIQFFDVNDYKLGSQVEVYSLKSNTWTRIIHDFPYYLWSNGVSSVSSGGALHWVVFENDESNNYSIGAFDLATKEYRLMPMPNIHDDMPNIDDDDEKVRSSDLDLTELEGCLCILWNNWEEECTDVWVMKSYGVRESWTKLISVGFQKYFPRSLVMTPLAFPKDRREVLLIQKDKNLVWFELESKVEKMVDVSGLPTDGFQVEVVTQSLVPVLANGSSTYA